MSNSRRSVSVESTCTVLSCTCDDFWDLYDNDNLSLQLLVDDAVQSIWDNQQHLRSAEKRYRLDDLLLGMLKFAPHDLGKRYVAVALRIAARKGRDVMIDVGKAWLEHLFFPMMAASKIRQPEPSSSQTPTFDATDHESSTRAGQRELRAKVAKREQYHCAITGLFDVNCATALVDEGRLEDIPDVGQTRMETAHIIPFSFNNFEERDAAGTWDMLQAWTQIDIRRIAGSSINSPTNAIYMTTSEHFTFAQIRFYLEKHDLPENPNKYMVKIPRQGLRLSNGEVSRYIEFRNFADSESSIEPPNPEFLKVHAAFAKVLHLSAAAEYFEKYERDLERNPGRLVSEEEFALQLSSRLAVVGILRAK